MAEKLMKICCIERFATDLVIVTLLTLKNYCVNIFLDYFVVQKRKYKNLQVASFMPLKFIYRKNHGKDVSNKLQ